MCEIWSRLTIKTPEDVIDVLMSLLLTLNSFGNSFFVFTLDFEQVNAEY